MSEVARKPLVVPPGYVPSPTFTVELTHTVNDKVVSVRCCDVTASTEEAAIQCALEIGSSCQGGMFRVFQEGQHNVSARIVKDQC